jgi:pimeloyl-ACP methyl ester carboxylesterase
VSVRRGLAAAFLGLPVVGSLLEALTERRERRRFRAPGRMVDVGGYRLHVNVTGDAQGGPTVILDSGMVSFSSNWAWVQPEVARVARAVSYDRAGLGWSDRGPRPRDAGRSATELHAALHEIGVTGPYVLAGHSYGGLVLRAFAALYRDEVAGMVLVDASHPDQWARFGVSSKVLGWSNKVGSVVARFGVFRVFNGEYRLLAEGLPSRAYDELMALASTPRALATAGDAALAWDEISRPLVNEAGNLGDLPLIVLSVTEQPRYAEQLTALQAELPGLSSQSRHITVDGAYHEGLLSRQEHAQIVTDAILQVVRAVRSGQRLS